MNKVAVGAAALVVVAGGGVGFAAWSGGKVASELQAQTSALLAPFPAVKVVENSVSKGLFSSVHTVTLDLGCAPLPLEGVQPAADNGPAPKPVQITWRDHVRHGPVPGGRGLGLAVIDTEIVYPPEIAAGLARVFGDQAPLAIQTKLGFGGDYVSELSSPAFKHTEAGKGDIDWQGLRATVRGKFTNGPFAGGSYAFEAPGLNVNFAAEGQATGTLKVGRMAIQGDVLPGAGASWLLSAGQGTGRIESVAIAMTPLGGKAVDARFEDLVLSSDAKSDDKGLWSAASQMSFKGRVDDFPIDKVEMKVAIHRLHGASYQQLMTEAFKSSFSCHKPDDEATARAAAALDEAMQKGLTALLSHNPEYALERLAVTLGGKTAEMSYRLGVKGVTEADAALPLPQLVMTKAYAAATFKVENAWLEQVVKKTVAMKPTEGESQEETVQGTMAFLNGMIDTLATKGLLAREGDAVVSKASYEAGVAKINDQQMDVPLNMMLGQ